MFLRHARAAGGHPVYPVLPFLDSCCRLISLDIDRYSVPVNAITDKLNLS
jgi:hypothetical protein